MSGRAKKKTAAAPKKKANGYKMPAPIATGEVIHDTLMKKKWRIGPSIGVGGFGEIYSACQHENSPKKGSDYPFVIKIEPHENGPLFVEKHFYVRNANKDDKELIKFFTYINILKPRDVPDYTKCVQILEGYLKKHGKTRNSKLEFTPTKKTAAKGRAKKLPESEEEDVEETASKRKPKENGVKTSPRKKAKTKEPDSKEEDDTESKAKTKENGVEKPRRGRTPKILVQDTDSETENCENETPNGSAQTKAKVVRKKNSAKRKSTEPALLVNVKKTKLTPRATPPVRKGLVNTATQTSGSRTRKSPRQVSFDSPICAIIGEGKASKLSKDSEVNSSGDIFDDSFEIQEKKVKPRRKLLSDEEVTVKRVVKKKVTTLKPKAKSWRDTPAVLNGRSPPTS